ncbi:DoxX family protein [Streptomyces sp. TLI_105]|uniref:DoxX family protein n=1 Tax=Streptomyces sp. TLI_105 TaxID=1881019 RepID=UPI000899B5BC|nr:DoxX family protein [Streptomyces sp. TLI_105]SED47453.1 putative oxidoreductase [Streptomyces sp. TLI_105]
MTDLNAPNTAKAGTTPGTLGSPDAPASLTARLNQAQPYALGLFRIVVGLLFACHGASSLFGVLGGSATPAGTWPGWYAAVIQLGAGILVLAGLGTRSAAFLASGSMAYAYFKVHQPESLLPIQNGGESAAMFCWAFALLVFTGPGALALDRLFGAGETTAAKAREDRGAPVAA